MKKFTLIFLLLFFVNSPVLAIIQEDFILNSLPKDLKIEKYEENFLNDDFVENTLSKNLVIKNYKVKFYKDNLLQYLKNVEIVDYSDYLKYDYSIKRVPVYIKNLNYLTTKNKLKEGQKLEFALSNDIIINNKKIPENTLISARIETITQNAPFGAPSEIVIGNFTSKSDSLTFKGIIKKTGANRALWVVPAGYLGCCFFYAGLPLFFVRGGHAKLKKNEVFEIYY